MKTAKVKKIDFDRQKREIIVTIEAKSSMYVEEPKTPYTGSIMLMNSQTLIDGINLVLEHSYVANNAIKYRQQTIKALRKLYGILLVAGDDNSVKEIFDLLAVLE